MAEARSSSGDGNSLAGEASGDDSDGLDVVGDGSDVRVNRHPWESSLEQLSSEGVDLAEPAVLESGEVEPVGEESAPIE